MRNLVWIGLALAGLTACGGGGGSGTPAVPQAGQAPRATASISFTVPVGSQQVADVGRASQDVTAAPQRFSIFEDGAALFTDVALQLWQIALFAVIVLAIGIKRYRQTLD